MEVGDDMVCFTASSALLFVQVVGLQHLSYIGSLVEVLPACVDGRTTHWFCLNLLQSCTRRVLDHRRDVSQRNVPGLEVCDVRSGNPCASAKIIGGTQQTFSYQMVGHLLFDAKSGGCLVDRHGPCSLQSNSVQKAACYGPLQKSIPNRHWFKVGTNGAQRAVD